MVNDLTAFLLCQIFLMLGFAIGRITASSGNQNSFGTGRLPLGRPIDTPSKLKSIKINESTFVTNVPDSSLVKKGKDIGKSSTVDDDISTSVNRLAQLKKSK